MKTVPSGKGTVLTAATNGLGSPTFGGIYYYTTVTVVLDTHRYIIEQRHCIAYSTFIKMLVHGVQLVYIIISLCSLFTNRHFFQGALDLFNCDFIQVTDSVFEHNGPTSILKQDQYRGHAGGLSIGYNNISVSFGPVAYVSGCVFRNNTSDPTSDLVQTTSQLVQFSIFTGRGGGCVILINSLYSLNATVENCLFEQNYARYVGGGLYVGFNGLEHHIVTIHQVQFMRNQAPTAGGLEVAFNSGGNLGASNRLEVYDSNFTENIATFGGGVNIFTLGI